MHLLCEFKNYYADSFIDYFLFSKKVRNIIKLLKNKPISVTGLLVVQHRLKKQILNNRFGKVLGITDKIPENKFCDFPFFQLNINPSGMFSFVVEIVITKERLKI